MNTIGKTQNDEASLTARAFPEHPRSTYTFLTLLLHSSYAMQLEYAVRRFSDQFATCERPAEETLTPTINGGRLVHTSDTILVTSCAVASPSCDHLA